MRMDLYHSLSLNSVSNSTSTKGYYQNKVDALIDVDGHDEFVVLCALVGHIDKGKKDVYQHLPDLR